MYEPDPTRRLRASFCVMTKTPHDATPTRLPYYPGQRQYLSQRGSDYEGRWAATGPTLASPAAADRGGRGAGVPEPRG